MGNSSGKGHGPAPVKKGRRTYKNPIMRIRSKRDGAETLNGKRQAQAQKNRKGKQEAAATKPTVRRTLSLRPDGNTVETLMPKYYDIDWSPRGEIGKGHYATVYRGVYKATGQPVAVKRIKRSLARPATLKTEIRALSAVKGHPNIVQMHDVFYNSKHVVLIMELLGGGELFDRIVQNGAYSERDASQHVRKIASALQFMHSQGIVHRDMKPENLVLVDKSPNSEIKISDFGLSKILNNDQTTMVTVCGTRAYSAPEVNFGGPARSGNYTEKVDTWSLGVILYVILAAYHPFDPYGESNDSEIWSRICRGQWDFNDEVWTSVSPEAKDLITHLICIDPNKRYGTQEILDHKWITQYQQMPATPLRSTGSGFSKSLININAHNMSVSEDVETKTPADNIPATTEKKQVDGSVATGANNVVNNAATTTTTSVNPATNSTTTTTHATTSTGDVVMMDTTAADFNRV